MSPRAASGCMRVLGSSGLWIRFSLVSDTRILMTQIDYKCGLAIPSNEINWVITFQRSVYYEHRLPRSDYDGRYRAFGNHHSSKIINASSSCLCMSSLNANASRKATMTASCAGVSDRNRGGSLSGGRSVAKKQSAAVDAESGSGRCRRV